MKTLLRVLLAGAVLSPVLPVAAAPVLPDPSICKTTDGFVEVAKGWLLAIDEAQKTGKISQQDYINLATWWQQMQNWMIETDRVEETCLALLQSRRDFGF